MRKKILLISGVLLGLVVVFMFFRERGKENLRQMDPSFGWALVTGSYDIKAYHYQKGNLANETFIYENLNAVEDGTLFISKNNLDQSQTLDIRLQVDGTETRESYQIEMNQELDWDGGGWLLDEVETEFVIGQERPLVFQAAVDGNYKSIYKDSANIKEFTEYESAFEGVDELVIFTIIQNS